MENKRKEEFIKKAKSIFGDLYTYDKVEYVNSQTPITITCKKHGDFVRKPVKVINAKRGCPVCKKEQSRDYTKLTEEFIEKAKKVHGNHYDYSDVKYVNNRTNVVIKCPLHGEFEQVPDSHLRGRGCNECGRLRKTLTHDAFIKRAKEIHGDKYDYSKVVYYNSYTPIVTICPIHGVFTQEPHSHLKGYGCKSCGIIKRTKPLDKFIEEANIVHNNKYDYSKVEYKSSNENVKIICPIHGEFEQQPSNHLSGSGCPECSIEELASNTSEFIEKAKEVHGEKYDYSKVNYVNNHTPVTIICKEHGEFEQTPNGHLTSTVGCRLCALESVKLTQEEFIEKAKKVHNNKYDYSLVKYKTNKDKVTIVCPKHGKFKQIAGNHLFGKGCLLCNGSSGELVLEGIFKKIGIKAIREYKINGYNYRFDFYLPDYDIFIELHGDHHYRPVKHWGGEEKYKRTIKNDKIKEKLVKDRGSKLIVIKQPIKNYMLYNILINELKSIYPYMFIDMNGRFHKI